MMDELVRVEGLKKYFHVDKDTFITAAHDVSFSIGRGETLGLVGESGSGKTTVGRCVLRIIEPSAGTIMFDGQDITKVTESEMRALRPRAQLVFQEHFASLNPRWRVGEILEEPLLLHTSLGRIERLERVKEGLALVDLRGSHLRRYPAELTASEQQRVGIARAIATRPDLVVLDEPTSNLDPSARAGVLDVLMNLQTELGTSYLFISHDLTAVERMSHRIAVMYLGRIVETATTASIIAKQLHPYTKALLSAVLYPDPDRRLEPFALAGEIPSAFNLPAECVLSGRCPFVEPFCREGAPTLEEAEPGHFSACYRSREFVPRGVPEAQNGERGSSRTAVSKIGSHADVELNILRSPAERRFG